MFTFATKSESNDIRFDFNNLLNINIMKTKKLFLTGTVALVLLGGCNNDYDGQDIAGSKLVVSASIDQVNTRVADDGITWTVDDAIGVSDNLANPNVNIKYVAGSTAGDFSSATGIYILGDDEVTYTAYYPYAGNEGTSAGVQSFKIADESGVYVGHNAVDFMYATGTATRSNPNVAFLFKHQMSKVSLKITDSNAAATKAEGTPISYTLQGVIIDGTFDTATGEVKPGTTKGNVKVEAVLGASSSVILPPVAADGTAEAIQLVIEVGDKVYAGTLTPDLDGSQEYQYSVDLSKTESGEKLQIDSPTIEGWTPNDKGDIGVEEKINYNPTLEIGDFFCKDGTTIDKDYDLDKLEPEMKNSIVGVVYYLGNPTSTDPVLAADCPQCTHGLVVALNNANEESSAFGTAANGVYDWLSVKAEEEPDTYASYLETRITKENGDTGEPSAGVMQGYNNTKQFILATADNSEIIKDGELTGNTWSQVCDKMIEQLNFYRNNVSVSAAGSSDWYLPSWHELDMLRQNYSSVSGSFTSIGATLDRYEDFTNNSDGSCYWSSTERAANIIWVSPLHETVKTDKQQIARTKNKGYFRFVLAF